MQTAGKLSILHRSRRDEFRIWNFADLHYGNRAIAMDELRHDIEKVRTDPHAYWFGGGDYAECIGYDDKRFDPDCVTKELDISALGRLGKALMEQVRDLLMPIRHKCLGMLLGNHEKRYQVVKEQGDLHGWLCTELGAINLGYCALIDVVFIRSSRGKVGLSKTNPRVSHGGNHAYGVRFFLHHGAGYAQTAGGKLNRLTRFMDSFDADVYFVAHVHDQLAKRITSLGANRLCTELVDRTRVGVVTGTYLRTYHKGSTTYGEQRGYRPVPLGARFVRIIPELKDIKAEI